MIAITRLSITSSTHTHDTSFAMGRAAGSRPASLPIESRGRAWADEPINLVCDCVNKAGESELQCFSVWLQCFLKNPQVVTVHGKAFVHGIGWVRVCRADGERPHYDHPCFLLPRRSAEGQNSRLRHDWYDRLMGGSPYPCSTTTGGVSTVAPPGSEVK